MASDRKPSFLRAMARKQEQPWTLRQALDGRIVASAVIPAFDRDTRNKGLLGRDSLDPGSAMILAPCGSVHTFFMKFAIDIVFVSREGEVLKIVRHCRAWRLAFGVGAFAVIELASGAVDTTATRVRVGDRLELA
jgi:uncharacterized protein